MTAHQSARGAFEAPQEEPLQANAANLAWHSGAWEDDPGRKMRVLVLPHDLAIGGSQINAIDLASGVALAGHDVSLFGVPGPLVDMIADRGLEFVGAHGLSWRPSPTRIAQLVGLARRRKIDVIHAYEWSTCLDAYFGPHLCLGVPLLCTVFSMSATPLVPPSVPLVMGTEALGQEAGGLQTERVWVLEPPIDTTRDHPAIDGSRFRRHLGMSDDEFLIVIVSRLSLDIKIDALVRAIDAMQELAPDVPARLVIVGDGQATDALRARAETLNRRLGRDAVLFAGPRLDPRTAYAAADLVLGMGSSALRALAIGRPLVVQGLNGFSDVFGPDTLPVFLRQGFFGVGNGGRGSSRLARQITDLYKAPDRRVALGLYGRSIVMERFSLTRGIALTLGMYREVLRMPPRRNFSDGLRAGWRALKLEVENHDPRQKRMLAAFENSLLNAARSETWPPQTLR